MSDDPNRKIDRKPPTAWGVARANAICGAGNYRQSANLDVGGGARRRFPAAYASAARRLPLCTQPTIPRLTRSSLHRCLWAPRHRPIAGDRRQRAAKKKFKAYPIGYFHIDIAEVQTAEGKLYSMSPSIGTSTFAFANWSGRREGLQPRPSSKL
jgi:hypothetical protein